MFRTIPLRQEHLEDAARLVSERYQHLCGQVPDLPQHYADPSQLALLLQDIIKPEIPGVAALQGSRLVGFLTAWHMPNFRGKRSIFSPEWANAAVLEDSARIYDALYREISGDWSTEKYSAHYISLFPNDRQALQQWHWLGFGMFAVDGLRSVEPIPCSQPGVQIRRAGLEDIETVVALHDELWKYIKGPPIFVLNDRNDRKFFEEWLQDSGKVIWLACSQDEPLAFLRMGPADDDVCTIIVDEQTTSIYAAFTCQKARRAGVATALLAQALQSAQSCGYLRCAVPFEPMNRLGSQFWLRYFQPVCYSFLRIIDERLTEEQEK